MTTTDFWKLLAGLGMFLYGMFHLEDTMKHMEGRAFKLFLQKHTKNKWSAIFSGAGVTAVLQSSSIVNLMVLSFVGAGMLSMRNALGVVLGANVGGTFNSWLVALLGFKIDIGNFTMPIIGLAGIALIVFRNNKKLYQISKFCMGFGLLFLGLDFLKISMDSSLSHFDFKPYLHYHKIVFVLIGFIITALIQTSAATVVIVLSALYANIIPIETAVVIVLGAELGTTIKLLLGSIGGIAAKKRVAFGNIIFNIVSSLIGFVFLSPIIHLLQYVFGISDPVMILVSFQTFINILGVLLFYFFLNRLGDFLEKRFAENENTASFFIQNTSPEISDTAIEMLGKEVGFFIYRVIQLNMAVFQLNSEKKLGIKFEKFTEKKKFLSATLSFDEKYKLIKQAEGEILSFYAKMAEEEINQAERFRLNQLMASVRNAMYSAKGMKDINPDRKELSNSANELKFGAFKTLQQQLGDFYTQLNQLFLIENKTLCFEALCQLLDDLTHEYQARMTALYKDLGATALRELDISTLFNVNRELYSSGKAIIFSLKDYLLDKELAEKFENIPESKPSIN